MGIARNVENVNRVEIIEIDPRMLIGHRQLGPGLAVTPPVRQRVNTRHHLVAHPDLHDDQSLVRPHGGTSSVAQVQGVGSGTGHLSSLVKSVILLQAKRKRLRRHCSRAVLVRAFDCGRRHGDGCGTFGNDCAWTTVQHVFSDIVDGKVWRLSSSGGFTGPCANGDTARWSGHPGAHVGALPEQELSTDSQRARRSRILDSAVAIAGRGGYDRVHMRDIAEGANVSLATLYHYFPSKVHLLTIALSRELLRFDSFLLDDLKAVEDPFARLRLVVSRLINGMEQSERVTEALAHAYVAAHAAAGAEADIVRRQTADLFMHQISSCPATAFPQLSVTAEILADVWTSEILGLVQRRRTYADIHRRLTTVIELIATRHSTTGRG